jgi:2-C-methyl-D-erythritol 2,4-cyclodiphosphate synthase
VIDALLGAARLGDIGRWFPSGDDRWRDADSQVLLAHVVERLRELEIEIVNVDAVVIAQRPRLAAHLDAMEATLAATLRVPPGCVSVKATTTDRLGTIGRAEGIAAQAVALLLNRRD